MLRIFLCISLCSQYNIPGIQKMPKLTPAAREKFEGCIKCTCCPRHQMNRPSKECPLSQILISQINWWYTPQKKDTACTCDCRHFVRNICRQLDPLEDP